MAKLVSANWVMKVPICLGDSNLCTRIKDILINTEDLGVSGLIYQESDAKYYISKEDISIRKVGLVIEDMTKIKEYQEKENDVLSLFGFDVFTENRTYLGKARDYLLELNLWLIGSFLVGDKKIDRTQVVCFRKKEIIVKDSFIENKVKNFVVETSMSAS